MDRLEPQSIFIFPFLILIVIQNISSQGSLLKKSFFSDHPKLRLLVATPETFHCVQTGAYTTPSDIHPPARAVLKSAKGSSAKRSSAGATDVHHVGVTVHHVEQISLHGVAVGV